MRAPTGLRSTTTASLARIVDATKLHAIAPLHESLFVELGDALLARDLSQLAHDPAHRQRADAELRDHRGYLAVGPWRRPVLLHPRLKHFLLVFLPPRQEPRNHFVTATDFLGRQRHADVRLADLHERARVHWTNRKRGTRRTPCAGAQ